MPAILPIAYMALGYLKFLSYSLKLPTTSDWKQPQGDPGAKHYSDALTIPDKIAIPKCIPPMFFPQNPNKYHQDSCDTVGQGFQLFILKMLGACAFAHLMWKLQAKFEGLKIMSVSAIGQPGCLKGPDLDTFIKNSPTTAMMSGNEAAYRDAVAAGVSKTFKNWQDQVAVPGLPWYPAFAAFPGPMAPPMPNVPIPLVACISAKLVEIFNPISMKNEMVSALSGSLKQKDPDKQHEALFDAIATVLSLSYLTWLPTQTVMVVMGKGPIPTFAPPYVPVGPVVGGDNLPTPGHNAI